MKDLAAYAFLLLFSFTACQSQEQNSSGAAATEQAQTNVADSIAQKARRPAPEFHRIPTEMAGKRVYVCDDAHADVFHTKYDCEVLNTCQTVKKNVTLIRAVEVYGRYNCEVCSKDLAVIFDEQKVIHRR